MHTTYIHTKHDIIIYLIWVDSSRSHTTCVRTTEEIEVKCSTVVSYNTAADLHSCYYYYVLWFDAWFLFGWLQACCRWTTFSKPGSNHHTKRGQTYMSIESDTCSNQLSYAGHLLTYLRWGKGGNKVTINERRIRVLLIEIIALRLKGGLGCIPGKTAWRSPIKR